MISSYPPNPHYFASNGKPILLITSDHHYGAVINRDFDYLAFLDALAAAGMNFTRIYPGAYIERDGDFVPDNVLGPRPGRQILPWARSRQTGAHEVLGGIKFDLDTWDDDYFERLHGFLRAAQERDIIVDIAFFNGMYKVRWPFQSLFHTNNVQGVGTCESRYVQTLQDERLVHYQTLYVRRLTEVAARYENVLLDIVDEPNVDGCPPALYAPWISRMIETVRDAERPLARKHVIVQTIEPYTAAVPKDSPGDFSADPRVTATAHEYCWGIRHLDTEYEHGKPMILIETNYYPAHYAALPLESSRAEAWEFMVGGGAAFMHLSALYSTFNATGKGTDVDAVLGQLKALRSFLGGFDFAAMRLDASLLKGGPPPGTFARAISEPGKQYALYLHHSKHAGWYNKEIEMGSCYEPIPGDYREDLALELPAGAWHLDWVEPATARVIAASRIQHGGGAVALRTPPHRLDIALAIRSSRDTQFIS